MPKSRNRKKLSGYYVQSVPKLNKSAQKMLKEALQGINERTPKTKEFTKKALQLQAMHGSSINILKKLRQVNHIMHSTLGQ